MLTKLTLAVAQFTLLIALLSAPLYAQNTDSKQSIQYFVIDVHGIVCELCSHGVAKKIRKLTFIDPKQLNKGVRVDVNNQRVYIAIKNDAELDQKALFKAITSGGYEPIALSKTTHIEAEGSIKK